MQPVPDVPPLGPGDPEQVGAFRLTGVLGGGGQGTVYLGQAPSGGYVAVKVPHARLAREPAARQEFLREADAVRRVAAFCTAAVLDMGVWHDRPYIVTEYIAGTALDALVNSDGPRVGNALYRLAVTTLTALAAIHRAGIVHRDFKPSNVILGPEGPVVIDFGIARVLDRATTRSGLVGTPAYISPELFNGEPATAACDVFSWAATMTFAATGRPAFSGESLPAVMNAILTRDPDLTGVPGGLSPMLAACLRKQPLARPTIDDLLGRLTGGDQQPPGETSRSGHDNGPVTDAETADLPAALIGPPSPHAMALAAAAPTSPPSRDRTQGWYRRKGTLIALGAALLALTVSLAVLALPRNPFAGGSSVTTIKIGFMGDFNGDLAGTATPQRNAAQLALDQYNATNPRVKLQLVPYDSKGRVPAGLARAAISQDKIVALIGPLFSTDSREVQPILEDAKIPSISPSASHPDLAAKAARFWHRIIPNNTVVNHGLAEFVGRSVSTISEGRAFVIDTTDSYSQEMAQAVAAATKSKGRQVRSDRIDQQATNFSSTVTKITAFHPDFIFLADIGSAAGPLIKQLRDKDVAARLIASDGLLFGVTEFIEKAGAAQAEGTIIACPCKIAYAFATRNEAARKFTNSYQTKYSSLPGPYTAESYDAATAIIKAVQAGNTTSEKINQFLTTIDFQGVSRHVKFTPTGEVTDTTIYIYRLKNGQLEGVTTADDPNLQIPPWGRQPS